MNADNHPLLEVENLKAHLTLDEGVLKAVDGVSFTIAPGQILGLVGESGCGKSMTVQALMRIEPKFARVEGKILFHPPRGLPVDLAALEPHGQEIRAIRGGDIAMIFQEPMTSFSPLHTIGNQIVEGIRLHRTSSRRAARQLAIEMLARVGISNPQQRVDEYPHQLSGGMRQRAMIAMALACEPSLLIADEPTTALDVTVQAQVLQLMRDLQSDFGMAILYITHDLGVVANMVDEVAVMYLGKIVEYTDVNSLFANPLHPYTQALLKSVPKVGKKQRTRLASIEGSVPVPINRPPGCAFYARCTKAIDGLCNTRDPQLVEAEAGHRVSCFLYQEEGEAVDEAENQGGHYAG
ncbi:MAG: ABC transporter ATP-binding protein [Trueperaceae bacterium]|nr:MAG: ABC transporter ATP-binding protein [Trueperaceae bacterium]